MISSVAPTRSWTFYAYLITKIGNCNLKDETHPECGILTIQNKRKYFSKTVFYDVLKLACESQAVLKFEFETFAR